ncbi:MAG: hypothetical protein V1660_02760 [archaeon]
MKYLFFILAALILFSCFASAKTDYARTDGITTLEVNSADGAVGGENNVDQSSTTAKQEVCSCQMGEECKSSQCVVTQKATATQIRNLMIASLAGLVLLGIIIYIVYVKMQREENEREDLLNRY